MTIAMSIVIAKIYHTCICTNRDASSNALTSLPDGTFNHLTDLSSLYDYNTVQYTISIAFFFLEKKREKRLLWRCTCSSTHTGIYLCFFFGRDLSSNQLPILSSNLFNSTTHLNKLYVKFDFFCGGDDNKDGDGDGISDSGDYTGISTQTG